MNPRYLPCDDDDRFKAAAAEFLGYVDSNSRKYDLWRVEDRYHFLRQERNSTSPYRDGWDIKSLKEEYAVEGTWWARDALKLIKRKADPSISPHSRPL